MKGKTTFSVVLLLSFILATQVALFAQQWFDQPLFPEEASEKGPCWGAWFFDGSRWFREAVAPDKDGAIRYFADVFGHWYSLEPSSGVPAPADPPRWYPWEDTPERRGLPPKGRDEVLSGEERTSFRMGEWENYFGGWFRRISPPGLQPFGVTHLIDSVGNCYILVVYPGASPRPVERFAWFTGLPSGWVVKPGTTVLVELKP